MNVASLCQRVIVTIDSKASLREAAALMRDEHVGALVVTGGAEPAAVVGVITDRDLAIEVLAGELDASRIPVGRLAIRLPVAVQGSAGIMQAVAAMERAGVRRLLVTDEAGKMIGFVTAEDLIDGIAAELDGLARALRSGIVRETTGPMDDGPADAVPVSLAGGLMPAGY